MEKSVISYAQINPTKSNNAQATLKYYDDRALLTMVANKGKKIFNSSWASAMTPPKGKVKPMFPTFENVESAARRDSKYSPSARKKK